MPPLPSTSEPHTPALNWTSEAARRKNEEMGQTEVQKLTTQTQSLSILTLQPFHHHSVNRPHTDKSLSQYIEITANNILTVPRRGRCT